MNLRGFIKYWLWRDTTLKGEFRMMERLAGTDCPRIFVDVGANDGRFGSNSFPYVARGWRCLLIEPHPWAFASLRKLHGHRSNVTLLNLACSDTAGRQPLWLGRNDEGGSLSTLSPDNHPHFNLIGSDQTVEVTVEKLEAVLAAHGIPHHFGILSVDAEGLDYKVLTGLNLSNWRPRVIVTEDYGPAIAEKYAFLESHRYQHRGNCGANSFWTPVRMPD